uniref:Uncharacterized protein n=1 Tax=Panagrolaimus superbus TaxID=310955 RepID=A0A914Z494_9BILA
MTATNLIKATSTSILAENSSAPVVGKQQFRIPDDANVNEYVAAFGSRPKVVRTPEAGEKPKPTVFMY